MDGDENVLAYIPRPSWNPLFHIDNFYIFLIKNKIPPRMLKRIQGEGGRVPLPPAIQADS